MDAGAEVLCTSLSTSLTSCGNGDHGEQAQVKESQEERVWEGECEEEILPQKYQRKRRLQRRGEMGAPELHSQVLDRCQREKEEALEKMAGMVVLLGGLGFQKTR